MTPVTLARSGLSGTILAGIGYGLGGYFLWGLSPVYFKAVGMAGVSPLELTAHRILFSFLLCAGLVLILGKGGEWRQVLTNAKLRLVLAATSVFLLGNWLVFVWAIDRGQVMACSLGYYINPLFAMLLGRLVLKERVSRLQWGAIALAAAGVLVLILRAADSGIWLALMIAVSWGGYALLRKLYPLDSLIGLTTETLVLFPAAIAYLLWLVGEGSGRYLTADGWVVFLLVMAGPVTAAPLVLFAAGWRRLRMVTMSLLQFLSPSLQFLLAVLLWEEAFTDAHAVAFACIWGAIAIYSWNSWRIARRTG